MERVERVDASQTPTAKELDRQAINAVVFPFFVAEFAMVVGCHPLAFESNELFEE